MYAHIHIYKWTYMHKYIWERDKQFAFGLISFTKPYAAQFSAMLSLFFFICLQAPSWQILVLFGDRFLLVLHLWPKFTLLKNWLSSTAISSLASLVIVLLKYQNNNPRPIPF